MNERMPSPIALLKEAGKPKRGKIHPILAFRGVRSADEAIKAIPEIQYRAGSEGMNSVHNSLFRHEDKPVSNVD